MTNAPQGGSTDKLTRTTLQIHEGSSAAAIAHMVHALQRVPGVLLAEINAVSARAIVAHDSAVATTSLIAAAAGAGVHATIVAETGVPAASANGALLADLPTRRLFMLVAALVLLLAFIEAFSPGLAKNHLPASILLSFVWAFIIARAMFSRRRQP